MFCEQHSPRLIHTRLIAYCMTLKCKFQIEINIHEHPVNYILKLFRFHFVYKALNTYVNIVEYIVLQFSVIVNSFFMLHKEELIEL